MANFTAADIKALREKTGAGMLAVKNALDEADGDQAKAIEILRVKGLKGVTKREDRSTTDGLVTAHVDGGTGVLIELNSETDFVAKSDKFIELAQQVLDFVVKSGESDVDTVLGTEFDGKTVKQHIDEGGAALGEKVALRRIARVSGGNIEQYMHRTNPDLPPQVGVLLGFDGADQAAAHDVAVHVAAMAPKYLTRDEVPEADVANERRIAEDTAKNENKPERAIPKIVEGRVGGFFKENVLLDQPFAKEPKKTVGAILEEAGVTLTGFARFRVGS